MATQHRIPVHHVQQRRSGRAQLLLAGTVAAMLLLEFSTTLAVLGILALAGVTGGLSLFRGRAPRWLVLLFFGVLVGTTLFGIFAWYDVATNPPTIYSTGD